MSLGRLLGQLLGRRRDKLAVGGGLDPAQLRRAQDAAASRVAGPGVNTGYVSSRPNQARREELIAAGKRKEDRRLGVRGSTTTPKKRKGITGGKRK